MNLRMSSQGFMVDHILGWAVPFGDAEVMGAGGSATEGGKLPARGQDAAGRAASGGHVEVSRPGNV